MDEPDMLADCLESRRDAIATFMAAWLEAGAQAIPARAQLPRDLEQVCRATLRDLIVWLRDRNGVSRTARSGDAWWDLGSDRARQLACSAIQEYLRSADDLVLEGLACDPVTPRLLSAYFLPLERPSRAPDGSATRSAT